MKKYYRGTEIIVSIEHQENLKLILAESHESGYIFQLICIEGYHSGQVYGYIEEQNEFSKSEVAVDKTFLEKQLRRNILGFEKIVSISFGGLTEK